MKILSNYEHRLRHFDSPPIHHMDDAFTLLQGRPLFEPPISMPKLFVSTRSSDHLPKQSRQSSNSERDIS